MPFEISHTDSDLSEVVRMITRLDSDVKIVMDEYSEVAEPPNMMK